MFSGPSVPSGPDRFPHLYPPETVQMLMPSTLVDGFGNPRYLADPRQGANHGVFIAFGQSNSANAGSLTPYTLTNPYDVVNLNHIDGGSYIPADPLLGCGGNGSCVFTRVGDKLVSYNKYDRVTIIPCGIGSSFVSYWDVQFFDYLVACFRRAQDIGLTITGVLGQIGESDGQGGVPMLTTLGQLRNIKAKMVSLGLNVPWMMALSTYFQGATSTTTRDALYQFNADAGNLQGPDTDTLGVGYRRAADFEDPGNVHFNATGLDYASTMWATEIANKF